MPDTEKIMQVTIYTRFEDAAQAEKGLAALLDRGASQKDLFAMFPEHYRVRSDSGDTEVEQAVEGITTTTLPDAELGAEKGMAVGVSIGAVAALASLVIPGFGIVTGGSALALALLGVAGATIGGAFAGGVAGYFEDQGVPTRIALDSAEALKNGAAVVAVDCPTGKLGEFEVLEILNKYHAESFGRAEDIDRSIKKAIHA